MNVIDESYLRRAHRLFPEMTLWQFEIMVLYSSGFTQSEIARNKQISRQAVSKVLNECKDRYRLDKIENVRSVFLVRRFLYL